MSKSSQIVKLKISSISLNYDIKDMAFEIISNWIYWFKLKKAISKCNKFQDLHREVLLNNATKHAENELMKRQFVNCKTKTLLKN